MMRRQIYDYSFLIILGLVLYGVLRLLSPFVGPLLVALMCAATFFPLYEAIQRILPRWNSSCQAGLTTVLVFLTFVTPIILLTWFVVQEATAIMPVLQQGRLTMDQWRNGSLLVSTPWMEHVRYFMSRVFGIRHAQFQQEMVQWVDASLAHVSLLGSL